MKNLRKALAAVMALAVMSVSATAFAATSISFTEGAAPSAAVSGSYDDANTITATVDTSEATTGTQMTFLILDNGTDVADIEESDILYIDQKELANDSNSFTGVINFARVNGAAVDATALPEGSYPIRLGYTDSLGVFTIASATLVVEAGSEEPATITIVWGDVNGNGAANVGDATEVVDGVTGATTTWTKEIDGVEYTFGFNSSTVTASGVSYTMKKGDLAVVWGDINGNGAANVGDATEVVDGVTGATTSWLDNAVGFNADTVITLEPQE
jgi:uncharacterized protein YkvS